MVDPSSSDAVSFLAEEFMERLRNGENPSVEEYARNNPDLADEIRDLFPTIMAMEGLKHDRDQSPPGRAMSGGHDVERLGEFRIIYEIGRGGMGIVYEAVQETLDRRVALKVLPQYALLNPKSVVRFQREAHIAASLQHPNIVPIFSVGESEGLSYIAMQLVKGQGWDRLIAELLGGEEKKSREILDTQGKTGKLFTTLAHSLNRDGLTYTRQPESETRLTHPAMMTKLGPAFFKEAADMCRQAARALDYAHSQGAIHRDIKPGNMLLDPTGHVWIMDFGLAKALEHDDITTTGQVLGTMRYMAPEQFEANSGHRADIYSLGLTLYELSLLRPAYRETSPQHLIRQIIEGSPPVPRTINPRFPTGLESIILKASARFPDDRYQSAREMADDLERFIAGQAVSKEAYIAGQATTQMSKSKAMEDFAPVTEQMDASGGPVVIREEKSGTRVLPWVLVAVLATLIAGWWILGQLTPEQPAATPPVRPPLPGGAPADAGMPLEPDHPADTGPGIAGGPGAGDLLPRPGLRPPGTGQPGDETAGMQPGEGSQVDLWPGAETPDQPHAPADETRPGTQPEPLPRPAIRPGTRPGVRPGVPRPRIIIGPDGRPIPVDAQGRPLPPRRLPPRPVEGQQ